MSFHNSPTGLAMGRCWVVLFGRDEVGKYVVGGLRNCVVERVDTFGLFLG